jgi:hypothetical protein
VHRDVVLHRGPIAELPLFDHRAPRLGLGGRREIGLVHARRERGDRAGGLVGGHQVRRQLLAQIGREHASHAAHQRQQLSPLRLVAHHACSRRALLMAVGALALEFLTLARILDPFEHELIPAVGGKLRGDCAGSFALDDEIHPRVGSRASAVTCRSFQPIRRTRTSQGPALSSAGERKRPCPPRTLAVRGRPPGT